MATVRMMAPTWRLAGNPAFEQSQQYLFDKLAAAGMSPRDETFSDSSTGWEQRKGTLRLGGGAGEVLLSQETHRVALAINSFSTPAGGIALKLVEAGPDPSALWQRPSDPHSEWGAGQVDPATVRTNPYEGGSDRTVFTNTDVPALLNWHFTDRYYHTNLDTVEKTSPAEMQHVAIAVATTALYLSAADAGEVMPMTRLMEAARDARMATKVGRAMIGLPRVPGLAPHMIPGSLSTGDPAWPVMAVASSKRIPLFARLG